MSSQAGLGKKSLDAKDFTGAVTHYTAALKSSPGVPLWRINRSIAYQKLGQPDLALADLEVALHFAEKRGKRDEKATAQLRRGIAYNGLKRFGDARICFLWASNLQVSSKEKPSLGVWMAKNTADFQKAGGNEAECNKVTAVEQPVYTEPEDEEVELEVLLPQRSKEDFVVTPGPITPTPKEKIRTEWYQTNDKFTITIFAKGVPKEQATISFEEGSVEIHFPIGSTSAYTQIYDPLYAKIDPAKSSYTITPSKVELSLHKAVSSIKWSAIEGSEPIVLSPSTTSAVKDTEPAASSSSTMSAQTSLPSVIKTTGPSYPTSSRTGPKDWDKIVGGDDDDDEENAKDPDYFFKQLYKDADDDTKKAMIKSYQESNGTSLSTNWSDVKKAPVEVVPPTGVEAKPWN